MYILAQVDNSKNICNKGFSQYSSQCKVHWLMFPLYSSLLDIVVVHMEVISKLNLFSLLPHGMRIGYVYLIRLSREFSGKKCVLIYQVSHNDDNILYLPLHLCKNAWPKLGLSTQQSAVRDTCCENILKLTDAWWFCRAFMAKCLVERPSCNHPFLQRERQVNNVIIVVECLVWRRMFVCLYGRYVFPYGTTNADVTSREKVDIYWLSWRCDPENEKSPPILLLIKLQYWVARKKQPNRTSGTGINKCLEGFCWIWTRFCWCGKDAVLTRLSAEMRDMAAHWLPCSKWQFRWPFSLFLIRCLAICL